MGWTGRRRLSLSDIELQWRGPVTDADVVELTVAHGGVARVGWWERVAPHSLGWVTAWRGGMLVGFVNVAWDGGEHAFLLDTETHPAHQRQGLATAMVALATTEAGRAGCAWLHVDFEAELAPFYLQACGFTPTAAGLIRLHLRT